MTLFCAPVTCGTQANPDFWTCAAKASMNFNCFLPEFLWIFIIYLMFLSLPVASIKIWLKWFWGPRKLSQNTDKSFTYVWLVLNIYFIPVSFFFLQVWEAFLIKIEFMLRPRWAKLLGNVFSRFLSLSVAQKKAQSKCLRPSATPTFCAPRSKLLLFNFYAPALLAP